MKALMYWSFLFLLFGLSIDMKAQISAPDIIRKDLEFLANAMEKSIPCLLEYHPEFREQTGSLITSVNQPLDSLDYFALISQMAALGNEGHIGVVDGDAALFRGFSENRYKYIPMSVQVVGDQLYIKDIYTSTEQLKNGMEIVSINGRSATAIIKLLQKHIPSDGIIQTFQRLKISDGFNWLYYLYIEQAEFFDLSIRISDSDQLFQSRIAATSLSEMREFLKNSERAETTPAPSSKVYHLSFPDKHALLELKSFDWRRVKEEDLKSRKLYRQLFQEIRQSGVEHLIIDLRGNTGGRTEFAFDIIPFINQTGSKGIAKTSISWKGKTRTFKIPKPDKALFTGQLIVLVDGQTYSAGASLARYLKEYGKATIIGEETGTRYEGFAGGSSNLIMLPHSGWKVRLPRYHTRFPKSKLQSTTNRGLLPDIEIRPIEQYRAASLDQAYQEALKVIGGNGS